ncbi:MAG: cell division protein FtsQ/DivIB [Myxococcota bacterium]
MGEAGERWEIMGFGKPKNRRRVDGERAAQRLKASASRVGSALGRVLAALALGAGLAGGVWFFRLWALASPRFSLQQVQCTGLTRASQSELLRLAGLAPGQNLFSLDVDAAQRAMASHPWVQSVTVTRRLPHGLDVTVVEHQPVAVVALGELYLLDDAGVPFKRLQPHDGVDLPLLTGVAREAYVARPEEMAARFMKAVAVAKAYQAAPAARTERLSEVRLEGEELVLVVGEGQEVRLGTGDAASALARLERVRAELARRGLFARVVRLDNRSRPQWVTVETEPRK